jgi:dienelactone hydrolase
MGKYFIMKNNHIKALLIAGAVLLLPLSVQAGQKVTYSSNGADYEGYSAAAKGTVKGTVLVIHDWDGLTGYEEKRSEMLASMGYNAFAVDLYGKGNRPVKTGAKKAETGKLYKDRTKMRRLILAGLSEARKSFKGKAVIMGYCFGGAAVLELARSGKASDISGYATFHGGLNTPKGQSYPKSTPPIFVAHGGADKAISMDQVAQLSKELEATGVSYEMQVYSGAPHAFTVIGSPRYRKVADTQSWAALGNFLKTNLK